ncbi:S-adenosylmethionine synthetase N-terminal domain-containing protein [Algihabitans albus]|uniref:S-adenosylmethionine synthetase N-terminal domain-containing protein n=1 Tax=Algihabitans albus TaxID=2164067 RepID=UPI0035CF2B3F
MADDFIFTSGSLTLGHPDKLCDKISDAVVDHFLTADPLAHVNAECAVATGILFWRCASPAPPRPTWRPWRARRSAPRAIPRAASRRAAARS